MSNKLKLRKGKVKKFKSATSKAKFERVYKSLKNKKKKR